VVLSALNIAQADAQEEQKKSQAKLDSLLEEVVVTARKREESLQDTPISVSAFTGESLEMRGITNISDIDDVTPNLTYQKNPQAGGSSSIATVYIRGVGQRDFLGTIDNGVGFYIDDVYVARTVGASVDLLEVDRIEVLRGPQGTLFGRNNVGGAIKIHSKKPADEFGGNIQASYGTDDLVNLRGTVNIPVNDRFLTKFSALYTKQDGYVDSPVLGDLGDDDTIAVRGSFLWDMTDDIEVRFSASYTTEEENGPPFLLADAGALVPGGFAGFHNNVVAPGTCAYPGGISSTNQACYNDQWVSDKNNGTYPTYSNIDTWNSTLAIEWKINEDLTLKSITAYRDLDSEFARDSDESPLKILHLFDNYQSDQVSQEIQLMGSSFDGKLDWITGFYYFDENGNNQNLLEFSIADFISGSKFGSESKALFAQGTYHVNDKLDITVGMRYTKEEKSYDPDQIVGPNLIGIPYPSGTACLLQDEGANLANGTPGLVVNLPPSICPVAIVPPGLQKKSTNEITPMVNVAYNFNDELMTYATYSEGFRSGGFVQRIFPPLPFVPSFGPEFVKSYELGFKFTNDQGNFSLNGAGFFMDYSDIQVRTQNPGFIGEFEANVGDAEIAGFELESKWQPLESWFIEMAVGYTDAKYTAIRVDPPLVAEVNLNSEFDHVPEWSLSASVSKEFDFGAMGSLVARVSGNYHSGYFNNPANSPSIRTPATDIWNANLIWNSADESYTVTFGLQNFTNDKYMSTGYNNLAIGTIETLHDRGRQWTLNGRYNF
jgi:iron complex outermembrane recepter protein